MLSFFLLVFAKVCKNLKPTFKNVNTGKTWLVFYGFQKFKNKMCAKWTLLIIKSYTFHWIGNGK